MYWPDCTGMSDCDELSIYRIQKMIHLVIVKMRLPSNFEISSIYPNPFNPSVNITFSVTTLEHVNISVYDTIGRHIATLFDGFKELWNS